MKTCKTLIVPIIEQQIALNDEGKSLMVNLWAIDLTTISPRKDS